MSKQREIFRIRLFVFLVAGLFTFNACGQNGQKQSESNKVLLSLDSALNVSYEGPVINYNREYSPGYNVTSHGDTYYSAWGWDGTLFLMTDDTRGFNFDLKDTGVGNQRPGRNVTVNTLWFDPSDPKFWGEKLTGNHNALAYYLGENDGTNYCVWKGNGLGSYDSVLYLTTSDHGRCVYNDGRPRASGGNILKSINSGKDWQGPAPDYYINSIIPHPFMFEDPRFSRISFVEYGQDGASPGNPDSSQNYIYAVSNDGNWDNGDSLYLGRIKRSRMAWLDAKDWQFYQGTLNGLPQWGDLTSIKAIMGKAGKLSQTAMYYNSSAKKYIIPEWYYPRDPALTPADTAYYGASSSHHTKWEFYESDHPWGPWNSNKPFYEKDWPTTGYYNPTIPNKFISGDSIWLLFAGDYYSYAGYDYSYNNSHYDYLYSLHYMRLALKSADISTSVKENAGVEFSVYPNPASEEITIEADGVSDYTVQLLNILGKNVCQVQMNKTERINISKFSKGIYFLQLTDSGNNSVGRSRLVIQ